MKRYTSFVVSQQGTWTSACPAPLCASQSDTWGYSFIVASNPSTFPTSTVGQFTLVPVSGFQFLDNGVAVSSMANFETSMYFYNTNYGGGFGGGLSGGSGGAASPNLILNPFGTGIYAQLYSGSETSPTFASGSYAPVRMQFTITNVGTGDTNSRPVVFTATPEPAAGFLVGLGLLLACSVYRRRLSPTAR
jgi:hypothetical protein